MSNYQLDELFRLIQQLESAPARSVDISRSAAPTIRHAYQYGALKALVEHVANEMRKVVAK